MGRRVLTTDTIPLLFKWNNHTSSETRVGLKHPLNSEHVPVETEEETAEAQCLSTTTFEPVKWCVTGSSIRK